MEEYKIKKNDKYKYNILENFNILNISVTEDKTSNNDEYLPMVRNIFHFLFLFTGKENKSHFQEDKDMTFVQIWSNCLEANSQEQHLDITDNTITDKSVKISNIVSKSIYLFIILSHLVLPTLPLRELYKVRKQKNVWKFPNLSSSKQN